MRQSESASRSRESAEFGRCSKPLESCGSRAADADLDILGRVGTVLDLVRQCADNLRTVILGRGLRNAGIARRHPVRAADAIALGVGAIEHKVGRDVDRAVELPNPTVLTALTAIGRQVIRAERIAQQRQCRRTRDFRRIVEIARSAGDLEDIDGPNGGFAEDRLFGHLRGDVADIFQIFRIGFRIAPRMVGRALGIVALVLVLVVEAAQHPAQRSAVGGHETDLGIDLLALGIGLVPGRESGIEFVAIVEVEQQVGHVADGFGVDLGIGAGRDNVEDIGDIGVDGATYAAMEFSGEAVSALSIEERMTICNMAIEAGGKNGIIEADDKTVKYVKARTDKPFEVIKGNPEAAVKATYNYNCADLEPCVAMPHLPDKYATVASQSDVKLTRAYIGSCTGGKTEDFIMAASILNGHKVSINTFIVPATTDVSAALLTETIDGKPLVQIFAEAGCEDIPLPSCAACLGGPKDTFGRANQREVVISTTNRNFIGRMGSKEAEIYLASPLTAAASAITGHITDPREFM